LSRTVNGSARPKISVRAGLTLALRALRGERKGVGSAFVLFAAAELSIGLKRQVVPCIAV